jgi:hypothetical protein
LLNERLCNFEALVFVQRWENGNFLDESISQRRFGGSGL